MSMTVKTEAEKASELKARNALATRRFCEALGVGVVSPKNLGYLTLALTEVVTDEIERDATLRTHIRTLFEELTPTKVSSARGKSATAPTEHQAPARTSGNRRAGPNDPPDLQLLAQQFSGEALFAQLRGYDAPSLKKAVVLVQEKHPGTRPKTLSKKDDIVSYLLEYAL